MIRIDKLRGDSQDKARILIVDDHPIVREGLTRLVDYKSEGRLIVCGEVDNAADALKAIEEAKPDLIIVDISLRGCSGLELCKSLRHRDEKIRILVLSIHEESVYAERALRAGADGYIMKSGPPDELLEAMQAVISGQIYVSDKIASVIIRKMTQGRSDKASSSTGPLSDRELEVFTLLGHGLTTREIAEELSRSSSTIETHISRLKVKLTVRNMNELIQQAVQWVNSSEGG